MVASGVKRHRDTHVIARAADGVDLLHTALIYGGNASGKTNLIGALDVLKAHVLAPRSDLFGLPSIDRVQPFRLDPAFSDRPTRFEVEFIEDGVRYDYGVEMMSDRVEREWLYSYPVRKRTLFERERDTVTLGPGLRKPQAQGVLPLVPNRPAALFLSLLGEFDVEGTRAPVRWFSDRLRSVGGSRLSSLRTHALIDNEGPGRQFVLDLLRRADTGIRDLAVREETVTVPEDTLRYMQEAVGPDAHVPLEAQRVIVEFIHGDDADVHLEEEDESTGTVRLFSLAGTLYDVLRHGKVLSFDEIGTSLHPSLVRSVVGLFHSPRLNPHGAQLIATTHETSLLNPATVRPDNVWLTEKDRDGASTLYSVTDFPVRSDAAFESLYLGGGIGGLPVLAFSLLEDIDDYAPES